MDSMLDLLPDNAQADEIMMQHYRDIVKICGPLQFTKENLNTTWNKSYGEGNGGIYWNGDLDDGRSRGNMPYYCPNGWVRLSLNVCSDNNFDKKYSDWGYLYHGTQEKFVGSILTSGLRGSKGICYCGSEENAVYFPPSIEYSGHPRYSSIEYNPETRKWIQLVLQCRVNPMHILKIRRETMYCKEFGIKVDKNVSNNTLEVLIKPSTFQPKTGHKFLRDAAVCTGVMMRVSDKHPLDIRGISV